MRKNRIIATSLFILASCMPQSQNTRPTIQYVKDIIENKDSYEYSVLTEARNPEPFNDIYIIGSEGTVAFYSDAFIGSDEHDNVDGRIVSDGLPDFAGETFVSVIDSLGSSYDGAGTDGLRRKVVEMVVASLGKKVCISRYDTDWMGEKLPAKMIILADSYMEVFGRFDVDTLFSATSCRVPVISVLDLMMDEVRSSKAVNPAFIANPVSLSLGVYGAMSESAASFCCQDPQKPISSFLDAYIESGRTQAIDCLVVDDISIDRNALVEDYVTVSSVMNEAYLKYGKLFSEDFRIIFPDDVLLTRCYAALRADNTFTHYIAAPVSQRSFALPSVSGNEGMILVQEDPETV